jgi:signal transduction histidine kinase
VALHRLAACVADDFNSVLGSVLGLDEVLSDALQGRSEHHLLDQLMDSVRATARTSHLLVGFSRSCALRRSVVPASAIVASCVQSLRSKSSPSIQIDLVPFDDHILINVDRTELERALLAVLTNAAESMPGGGKISVYATLASTDSTTTLNLRIKDSGSGMSEEVQQHAFEPYFTTKSKGRGRGLGLSFAQAIIAQHDGSMVL